MVRKELVDAIQAYQAQGYALDDIRQSLVSLGYPPDVVDESMASLGSKKFPVLIFVIIGLGIVIILVALAYTLISPAQKNPLTLTAVPVLSSLQAGTNLVFSKIIEWHGASQDVEITINAEVKNVQSQTSVGSLTEKVIVKKKKESKTSIPIPISAPGGRYQVMVTAQGPTKSSALSSFFITVSPSMVADSKKCPLSCEDYNPCTIDRCAQGSCVHEQVRPCCGNGICEEGEECRQDCTPGVVRSSAETIQDQAIKAAKTDAQKAEDLCSALPRQQDSDHCFSEIAKVSRESKFCTRISMVQAKDSCLMDFVVSQNEFGLCDQIEDPWLRNSCFSYKKLKSGPVEFS